MLPDPDAYPIAASRQRPNTLFGHGAQGFYASTDGGSTWTVVTPHSTADTASVDRYNQWLSVDNQGRVFVAYYDTRHSTNRTGTDLYYSMSSDGGVTWGTAQRLTAVTSRNITDSFEWGDYNGMDMVMQDIMAIYTDNRDETGQS